MQTVADRERREPRASLAWARAVLAAVAVVALDQLSKSAVEGSIVPGEDRGVLPGLQLVNTRNKGVAFGFLPGSHVAVTILIGVALLVLLVYFARHAGLPWIWLAPAAVSESAYAEAVLRGAYDAVSASEPKAAERLASRVRELLVDEPAPGPAPTLLVDRSRRRVP